MTRPIRGGAFFLLIIMLCFFLAGCTGYFKRQADREVYRIIDQKSEDVEGMPSKFTIEPVECPLIDDLKTTPPTKITLVDAIEIAVKNSREYQNRKESLYLSALSLTGVRHEYDPLFSGSLSATLERDVDVNSLSGALSLGMRKMLATGGDISISFVSTYFKYLNFKDLGITDPEKSLYSALSATLTQPLLRGAGRRVAMEGLTQAERDMIYTIRSFVQYRRSFSVDIAKEYWSLLQQHDELENSRENYESLQDDRIRAELMAEAGRLPEFQVDQARQEELSARDRYLISVQRYADSLDAFKVLLGLPTEVGIEPDHTELDRLAREGFVTFEIDVEDAIALALERRLDLLTTIDRVDDSERQLYIAKNGLLPGLTATAYYNNQTLENMKPLKFNDEEDRYGLGLDFELPFDKKDDRNTYRAALIDVDRAYRELEDSEDNITLEVRNAVRRLEQAEQSYNIQKLSLSLAERRVESNTLLHRAGRLTTRDLLDAQEDLLDAQNAITDALVEYNNARLDLLLATELLIIDDNGLWQEGSHNEHTGK
jgi:outer membrane protein TolC